MNGETSTSQQEEARERHTRFLQSLERHASGDDVSRAAWSNMASELGWSVEQVQVYAYRYMMALNDESEDQSMPQQEHQANGDDVVMADNEENGSIMNGNSDNEWTLEEDILLDSLLAVYPPRCSANSSSNNNSNHNALDWEEQVASRMPGKTPMQVRQRYNQLYGDRGNR